MKTITGNLIDLAEMGMFDVIVHGCNCFHTMGSGIAKEIKARHPEAYDADLRTPYADFNKLGQISYTIREKVVDDCNMFKIVNAYTQFRYGLDKRHADYDAIRSCFKLIKQVFGTEKIGYPKIGCGRAGGDWDIVSQIIDEELDGCDHTLVLWLTDTEVKGEGVER